MEGKSGESKAIVGYIMVYLRSSTISIELVSFIFPFFEFLFNFWLSFISTNMACDSSSWTREQDKTFENALAVYCGDSIDRWEKIASMVPGKTIEDIKHHYTVLVEDINAIEASRVPLPFYNDSASRGGDFGCHGRMPLRSHQERKKGIAWTEEEHRLFLMGLDKLGKGDWRGISRNFVVTRTPTQVASHAQKYLNRLRSINKKRRRASIHDITTVDGVGSSTPRGPITGKMDAGGSFSKNKNPTPLSEPDVRVYVPPTIVESSNTTLIPPIEIPVDVGSPIELLYDVGMPIPDQAYLLPP